MLKLSIFNQRLSYFSDSEVVADSKGYLVFTLETSEDWANYVGKTVQFTRNGVTYSVTNISDGVEYAVPWEVLRGPGIMYLNAFAVMSTGKRATTNQIAVEIIESGLNEDSLAPSDPTPDIFQQYVEQVQDSADTATQAAINANQSAKDALQYKNLTQQTYQQTLTIKGDIESLNNQVNQSAQATFQYAQAAETSAINASESEIAASNYASQAEQSALSSLQSKEAAETAAENAQQSESNALLYANKAEAQQTIVTNTKSEIDTIYEDIQNIQVDVTEKNNNVNQKALQVDSQTKQVEDWYNRFLTGCSYITFTGDLIHEEPIEGDESNTETIGDWTLNESTGYYENVIGTSGKALLSVQLLDDNGQYVITSFVDVQISGTFVTLISLAPFAGRIQIHSLVESPEITEG